MKITICTLKQKLSKELKDAYQEYQKRLSKYCKIDYKQVDKPEQLSSIIHKDTFIIQIVVNKDTLDSVDFNQFLIDIGVNGYSSIVFCIGFNYPSNKQLAVTSIQLSDRWSTLIILEQIYRSYRIRHNEPYHK